MPFPQGDDALLGKPESIPGEQFSASKVGGKFIYVAKVMTLRIYKDPGGETTFKEHNLGDFKKQVDIGHGCEVFGGEGVIFTTT